jgi:hypothetical protein
MVVRGDTGAAVGTGFQPSLAMTRPVHRFETLPFILEMMGFGCNSKPLRKRSLRSQRI